MSIYQKTSFLNERGLLFYLLSDLMLYNNLIGIYEMNYEGSQSAHPAEAIFHILIVKKGND